MELETRTIDGIMVLYCISIYEDDKIKIWDILLNNNEDMLIQAIKSIMITKYNDYKIYLHNFSKFDVTFLINILSQLTDNIIKPKIRDGRYIEFKFSFGPKSNKDEKEKNNKINLYFRISLLLLPSSLKELAIILKVDNKVIFPYKIVNNETIPLDYIREITQIDYYKINIEDYLN